MRRNLAQILLPIIDLFLSLFVYPSGLILKVVRGLGVHRLPRSKSALLKLRVFPIRDHYYEPLFDHRHLSKPLWLERELPGIDLNVEDQLTYLEDLRYSGEFKEMVECSSGGGTFFFGNESFESGDAEYWYNLIRDRKPERIIEVGSGYSTLIARRALAKNLEETHGSGCVHVCIEPFEQPWLEQLGLTVVRQKVEAVDKELFRDLKENDILFIDSSHIIRPQGDVLFEYLEVLPTLNTGVLVHIHDIFTPRDYLSGWVIDKVKFWNEQYLLEAFLTENRHWKVVGALNHLFHHHYDALRAVCPYLEPSREPGSFYIQRVA